MGVGVSGRGTDFFISHAGRDTGWAEWLAWQLQEAGYTVELDVWDWAPGEDFVARMAAALERADRLLAVCSEAYFSSAFGGAELRAAFAQRGRGADRAGARRAGPPAPAVRAADLPRPDRAGRRGGGCAAEGPADRWTAHSPAAVPQRGIHADG